MSLQLRLQHAFNVRPGEGRSLGLSLIGAFLIIAFAVLARSLREAAYLSNFPIETLPYITVAAVLLSLPAVSLFSALLLRFSPQRLLLAFTAIEAVGLAILWPFSRMEDLRVVIVIFYLWTTVGGLILTSGFWVVASEAFAVRGAKRLFTLIGAGGTAGAFTMGLSLSTITSRIQLHWLIPLLFGLLALFFVAEFFMPGGRVAPVRQEKRESSASAFRNLGLIVGNPHLRLIAFIVFVATMASALVDFQFKEQARAAFPDGAALTGFLGAFYGWAGGIALFLQLAVASRIMSRGGIGRGLAVLPCLLIVGSVGLFFFPGLAVATLLRGGDNALRKSLFRPLLEFLYVPLPAALRRRTKTVIDSLVDGFAEGAGALIIFLWVTLFGLSSRWLSVLVILLAFVFLAASRKMDRQYLSSIVDRLHEGEEASREQIDSARLQNVDLLSATFTRLDLRSLLATTEEGNSVPGDASSQPAGGEPEAQAPAESPAGARSPDAGLPSAPPADLLSRLASPVGDEVRAALSEMREWDEEHMVQLPRLLARDDLYKVATATLVGIGDPCLPLLAGILQDDGADFVIRRRIPRVLVAIDGAAADDALLDALSAGRFEVRYRAALALVQRRKRGAAQSEGDWKALVWQAVRREVSRERPVWELQRLLDGVEGGADELVLAHVDRRGARSLEHTFRVLGLVLDPKPVRAAFHGIILDDENLKSYSLEYLEQVLPEDIRERLWLFIGDASRHEQERGTRALGNVVEDLMSSRATLFATGSEREALRRMLEEREGKSED